MGQCTLMADVQGDVQFYSTCSQEPKNPSPQQKPKIVNRLPAPCLKRYSRLNKAITQNEW